MLASYLEQEEAATVMFTFADQEREFNRALQREREEGEARGEARGFIKALASLVQDHLLSITDAAKKVNMSEAEFVKVAGLKM